MPNEIKKNEIKNYIKNTSNKIKDYTEKIKVNSTQYINKFLENLSSYIYLLNKINYLIKNLKNFQNIKTITDLNIKKMDKDINTYIENINKLFDFKNEITIIFKIFSKNQKKIFIVLWRKIKINVPYILIIKRINFVVIMIYLPNPIY